MATERRRAERDTSLGQHLNKKNLKDVKVRARSGVRHALGL